MGGGSKYEGKGAERKREIKRRSGNVNEAYKEVETKKEKKKKRGQERWEN